MAEDVKRTIIKYFLRSYEIPLRIVIPQLFDRNDELTNEAKVNLVNKVSEEFYRDVIAEAFLMQPLDNFIAKILDSLRAMADNIKPSMINKAIKIAQKGEWLKVADEFDDLETLVATVGRDKI